jgi:hypothetical protein
LNRKASEEVSVLLGQNQENGRTIFQVLGCRHDAIGLGQWVGLPGLPSERAPVSLVVVGQLADGDDPPVHVSSGRIVSQDLRLSQGTT